MVNLYINSNKFDKIRIYFIINNINTFLFENEIIRGELRPIWEERRKRQIFLKKLKVKLIMDDLNGGLGL